MDTEIIFVLDRSGSMAGREEDTIGGYNRFLEQHQAENCRVTTVLFDDTYTILYDGEPIRTAGLDAKQYWVRGSTALYDAIGRTIMTVGTRHSHLKKRDRPRTYMVIITDGYENASREYSAEKVRELVERQRKKHGWEILFFGCDIDVEAVARDIALPVGCAAAINGDSGDYFEDILHILNKRM